MICCRDHVIVALALAVCILSVQVTTAKHIGSHEDVCTALDAADICTAFDSVASDSSQYYYCSDKYIWEWSSNAPALPHVISDSSCITFERELVTELEEDVTIIMGGCDADVNREFCNSVTNASWEFATSLAGDVAITSPMPRQRYRFAAANVSQYVFVFGGRNVTDALTCEIDYLDIVTREWNTLDTVWEEGCASDLGAFSTDDGSIYIVGGYTGDYTSTINDMYKVNVDLDTKTASFTPMAGLETSRGDVSCWKTTGDNYAYCMGGFIIDGESIMALKSTERYDVSTNTWTTMTNMTHARGDYAIGYLNGRIHVIGGEDLAGPIKQVEWYDPETDCWSDSGDVFDIPYDRFRYCAGTHRQDSRIYIFGGQGDKVNGSYYLNKDVFWYQELSTGDDTSAAPPAATTSVLSVLMAAAAALSSVVLTIL